MTKLNEKIFFMNAVRMAIDFRQWCEKNEQFHCFNEQRDIPTNELFDIFYHEYEKKINEPIHNQK